MSTTENTFSYVKDNISAIGTMRDRLRSKTKAVADGLCDAPRPAISGSAPDTTAERIESMGNAMDSTFALMQQQVVSDVRHTLHRLDAIARFNTTNAQAHQSAMHETPRSPASQADGNVIDVQAKDIAPIP